MLDDANAIITVDGGTFNYINIDNEFADDTCIYINPSITNVEIN